MTNEVIPRKLTSSQFSPWFVSRFLISSKSSAAMIAEAEHRRRASLQTGGISYTVVCLRDHFQFTNHRVNTAEYYELILNLVINHAAGAYLAKNTFTKR